MYSNNLYGLLVPFTRLLHEYNYLYIHTYKHTVKQCTYIRISLWSYILPTLNMNIKTNFLNFVILFANIVRKINWQNLSFIWFPLYKRKLDTIGVCSPYFYFIYCTVQSVTRDTNTHTHRHTTWQIYMVYNESHHLLKNLVSKTKSYWIFLELKSFQL